MTYPVREDTLFLRDYIETVELEGKHVLEMGVGNGLVAVTMAENGAEVTAVDLSQEVLKDAKERAESAGVDNRLRFFQSDMFEEVESGFDLIVFNPPYLRGKQEGNETWAGGKSGVEVTRSFMEQAPEYLREDGHVLFVASSLSDVGSLEEEFDLELVSEQKLWFEMLYLFKSD